MNTRALIDRAVGQRPMQIVLAQRGGTGAGPAYAGARDLCYAAQNQKADGILPADFHVISTPARASSRDVFGVIVALDRLGPVEVSTLSGRQETTPFRLSGGHPNRTAY